MQPHKMHLELSTFIQTKPSPDMCRVSAVRFAGDAVCATRAHGGRANTHHTVVVVILFFLLFISSSCFRLSSVHTACAH